MNSQISRRKFIVGSGGLGIGLVTNPFLTLFSNILPNGKTKIGIPVIGKGEKQIFADDVMIANKSGIERISHAANKLEHPVLESDKPWEFFEDQGVKIPHSGIYGTVLRNETTNQFRMWYSVYNKTCYAVSRNGVNWQKPELGQMGATNMINLFDFQSPSFIFDKKEADPGRRYKAVGSKEGFSKEVIDRLKAKFNSPEWYTRKFAYSAAFSSDGIYWEMYPEPILLGMDTITLAQNPLTGEYLAFHKQTQDPRSNGRQVFLSTSKDMLSWSYPELVMSTDEIDHKEARKLENGTHSEFYNMSAFYYAGQWLGLVTLFRCTGKPLENGKAKAGQIGIIDVQLVHSRDGHKWQRCSDRSPVIPVGPYDYDAGMIFGVCNTPIIIGDEMWMYYSASTDIHCGSNPDKKVSIARAAWRLDGMVSLQSGNSEGVIETTSFISEGDSLFVNADVSEGQLLADILDEHGKVIHRFGKENCITLKSSGVHQSVTWKNSENLPRKKPIRLRFYLTHGDLYSYTIE